MENPVFLIFYCPILITLSAIDFSDAADTLTSGQSIRDGETTLVSSGQIFELGFFSPGNSRNGYLGIWYKNSPDIKVWVANRDNPLTDSNGTLSFTSEGNLVVLNQSNSAVWSSNLSTTARNPIAQLLDSGNLVLRDDTPNSDNVSLWQSFDYPTDTLLPGMKLGWNLPSFEMHLTSWKASDDPSPGDYVYRLDLQGLPQAELVATGSTPAIKYRSGPWNGAQYSSASISLTACSRVTIVYNEMEVYYLYDSPDKNHITRLTLSPSGSLQRLCTERGSTNWTVMYSLPFDPCDEYGKCGPNGICRISANPICQCLEGFEPRSTDQWQMMNRSGGCQRKVEMNCSAGEKEGFRSFDGVKLPNLLEFSLNENTSLEECRVECLKNCSCTAYAYTKIIGGTGCIMWFGDLVDIRELKNVEHKRNIYVRVPASELDGAEKNRRRRRKMTFGMVSSAILGLFILTLSTWCIVRKRRMRRQGLGNREYDIDLPLFNLATISCATDNFSETNLIGAGGFGPVYKGSFPDGREIAVKRLLSDSGQGIDEFMNEVVLIARLQHRNLVGLVGCCIEREERMLVYEYMPNKSLDHFIFDHGRSYLLGWKRRFDIIVGIARGLLYLHQDSKLQIIHRDLKTSNILLDANLNPKISDFGIARIFEGDEKEARTTRVIGTYGYMSPEYAFDGNFSVKSDVYSFGVLLLEIVSGRKNRGFSHPDHHHNLLGHAWLLWNQDRASELVDQSLYDSLIEYQVRRCIHVGLLCVQKFPEDRPAMSYVVSMLVTEGAIHSQPKQPGFFMERSAASSQSISTAESHRSTDITITMPAGR